LRDSAQELGQQKLRAKQETQGNFLKLDPNNKHNALDRHKIKKYILQSIFKYFVITRQILSQRPE
jgi:hypothetical protein